MSADEDVPKTALPVELWETVASMLSDTGCINCAADPRYLSYGSLKIPAFPLDQNKQICHHAPGVRPFAKAHRHLEGVVLGDVAVAQHPVVPGRLSRLQQPRSVGRVGPMGKWGVRFTGKAEPAEPAAAAAAAAEEEREKKGGRKDQAGPV